MTMKTDKTNIKDKLTEKPYNISPDLWIDMNLPDVETINVKILPGGDDKRYNEVKSYLMKATGMCVGGMDKKEAYLSAELTNDQIWGLLRYHVKEIDLNPYKE